MKEVAIGDDAFKMKLSGVRIRNYRCIIDSGWFKIEDKKTIFVGKNESGKSVILRALQLLNRNENRIKVDKINDYPEYLSGKNNESEIIVSAKFKFGSQEAQMLSELFGILVINKETEYLVNVYINNDAKWEIVDTDSVPSPLGREIELKLKSFHIILNALLQYAVQHNSLPISVGDASLEGIVNDIKRQDFLEILNNLKDMNIIAFIANLLDMDIEGVRKATLETDSEGVQEIMKMDLEIIRKAILETDLEGIRKAILETDLEGIQEIIKKEGFFNAVENIKTDDVINIQEDLIVFLESHLKGDGEKKNAELPKHLKTITIENPAKMINIFYKCLCIGDELLSSLPQFIFFSEYYRIDTEIHLEELLSMKRSENSNKDLRLGTLNLIRTLGSTIEELSEQGKETHISNQEERDIYNERKTLRKRNLAFASRRLTEEINRAWQPEEDAFEARHLRVIADGQQLVFEVSEDGEHWIKFNRRSNGYQWLVSFYITLIKEAKDSYKDAIFLLDEPALSLHGKKQIKFRETLSSLAESNQTIYTTHSPFLVGPDELEMVRVVELKAKEEGTKVHNNLKTGDPASLYPLHAALGYDLSSSLFFQERNLVVEGYTDYLYFETTAIMLRNNGKVEDNNNTSLIFANTASLVPTYAAILTSNDLKVAVLFDSDTEGDIHAQRDELIETIGRKRILRVGKFLMGQSNLKCANIEDMLRDTLAEIASEKYQNGNLVDIVEKNPSISIVSILEDEVGSRFRKYDLAKAYVQWTKDKEAEDLKDREIDQWTKLINEINEVLK